MQNVIYQDVMEIKKYMWHEDQSTMATYTYCAFHYLQYDKRVTYIRMYELCSLLPSLLIYNINRIAQLV
jgi:hypothetical protein